MSRRLFDSSLFWLGLGAGVGTLGAIGVAIGAINLAPRQVPREPFFIIGLCLAGLGAAALAWALVLFLAHNHAERHIASQGISVAPTTVTDSAIVREVPTGGARPERPAASAEELTRGRISGRTVWLADLVRDVELAPIIAGRTFEDCDIVGPAIVSMIDGSSYDGCMTEINDAERIYWPFPEYWRTGEVFGVIAISRCRFVECRFIKVAMALPAEQIAAAIAKARRLS